MFGTKKKLMAAVVMLVISAIMLTSASYAWFTISTNPEISKLETKVVVHEALEIALVNTDGDAPTNASTTTSANDKQYTWGSLIDLEQVTYYTETLNTALRPATLVSGSFKYPEYGSDGRIDNLDNDLTTTTRNSGFGYLEDGTTTQPYAYYVDFWVRSAVTGNLVLQSSAVNRNTGASEAAVDTLGSYSYYQSNLAYSTEADDALAVAAARQLADNISIAFQDITTGSTDTPSAVYATLDDADIGAGDNFITLFSSSPDEATPPTAIIGLTRNEPKLIRMFVYLEGDGVSNLAASDDAEAPATPNVVSGLLNIQFALVDDDGDPIDLTTMND